MHSAAESVDDQSTGQGTAATTSTTTTNTPTTTQQQQAPKQDVEITNAWARPTLSSNNNTAIYCTIKNNTDKQIAIVGASALAIANNVELHKSFVDQNGVSKMTPVDKVVIPAQSTIDLAPAGLHIMAIDLKSALNEGDTFSVELKLEDRMPVSFEAIVKQAN